MNQDTLRAAIWMIGAISSFTLMSIAGRAAAPTYDTFEIMLYRSLVGIVLVLLIAGWSGRLRDVQRQRFGLHFVRNICHFTGQNLWFYAITVIPLAQVFALEFTSPIWVLLLSPLILQERITSIGLVAALLGFVGILIVARPDIENINPGVVAAAVAAIAFALTAIFTRRLTRHESITSILFWLTTIQAVFGLICAGYDGDIELPQLAFLPWLVAIGVAGLTAHFCLTKALSIAPASTVMPLDFVRLPVIMIVGWLLYEEAIDILVLLGAALIFAGNWLNLTRGQVPPARG